VELTLRTIPLGRKPYPLSREQLAAWYSRHGFIQLGKKMTRKPSSGATFSPQISEPTPGRPENGN
jgi:hypothetical protein